MPHTVVIALKLPPKRNDAFEIQLAFIEQKLRKLCQQLKEQAETSHWIISWQEYGLSNGSENKFISKEQKEKLKQSMQALTREYPKLTLISGTVLSKRLIEADDKDKFSKKLSNIKKAYLENANLNRSDEYKEYQEHVENQTLNDFYLIRNTAYVFSQGLCKARHDKTTPWHETQNLSNGLFRPGYGKSQSNLYANLGIEICLEHQAAVLVKTLSTNPAPEIQLILSDTTDLVPKNCISPYVIHIDRLNPTRLITTTEQANKVSLFEYDLTDELAMLKAILPQSIQSFIIEQINELMDKGANVFFDLNKYTGAKKGKDLLQLNHYIELLKSATTKYVALSATWKISKENRLTLSKMRQIKSLIEDLLVKLLPFKEQFADNTIFKTLVTVFVSNKEFDLLTFLLSNYQAVLGDVFQREFLIDFVIRSNRVALFQLILDHHLKTDINQAVNKNEDTALHLAIRYQALSILQCLLKIKPDLNRNNANKQSPLSMFYNLPYLKATPVYKAIKQYQQAAFEATDLSHLQLNQA